MHKEQQLTTFLLLILVMLIYSWAPVQILHTFSILCHQNRSFSIWVFPKIGVPQNYNGKPNFLMDDLGYIPLFSETSISDLQHPGPGWFRNQGAISLGKEDVVQQGPSCNGAMSSRLTFWDVVQTGWNGWPDVLIDPIPPRLSTVVSTRCFF